MARKAKPGTGLATAQKYLGLVQNAQGTWVRPGAGLATKTMQTITENLGYQPGGTGGRTPLATPKTGQRLGFVDSATGQFSLLGTGGKGKSAPPARPTGPMGKKHKKGHMVAGASMDELTNTAIENTTALGKSYGKTNYRTAQFTAGSNLPEFGKSGTGKKKQPEAPQRNAPRQGKRKGRKTK